MVILLSMVSVFSSVISDMSLYVVFSSSVCGNVVLSIPSPISTNLAVCWVLPVVSATAIYELSVL